MNILVFKIREWWAHHAPSQKNQTIAAQAARIRDLVSYQVKLQKDLTRVTEIAYGLYHAPDEQTFNYWRQCLRDWSAKMVADQELAISEKLWGAPMHCAQPMTNITTQETATWGEAEFWCEKCGATQRAELPKPTPKLANDAPAKVRQGMESEIERILKGDPIQCPPGCKIPGHPDDCE